MTRRDKPEICRQELHRQAARIFPKLAQHGAYLKLLGACGGTTESKFGLYTPRNEFRRPVLEVSRPIVCAWELCEWLERDRDSLVLSHAGLLWLRRYRSGADPFREQHQLRKSTHREVNGVRRPVMINDAESPLGWLRNRKDRNGRPLLTLEQFEAGERLRSDFERGQLASRITSNWEGAAPSRRMRRAAPQGPAALNDDALAARQRLQRALDKVGPELAAILLDTCCYMTGLTEVENARGWPQRSGKVVLQVALTELARHYGLLSEGGQDRDARHVMRHWGDEGYRPSLEKWQ